MRYSDTDGVQEDKKFPMWIVWVVIILVLAAAAYWGANYFADRLG